MSEKVIELSSPITVADKTITKLTVREPKAKHLRGVKIGLDGTLDLEALLDLGANLTGQLPAVIDELCMKDAMELGKTVWAFLPDGLKPAGKTESEQ